MNQGWFAGFNMQIRDFKIDNFCSGLPGEKKSTETGIVQRIPRAGHLDREAPSADFLRILRGTDCRLNGGAGGHDR